MRSIGIRCSPQIINYAIIENSEEILSIVDANHITIPKSLELPDQLKYIRNTLLDIINEYSICYAGIRATEPNSQTISINRLYYEGVIIELFANSQICNYYIGYISNISSYNRIDRSDFKKIIDNEIPYSVIPDFSSFSKERKEAVLTALGSFHD